MAEKQRVGDLEIHQNVPFQQMCWKLQRACWVVMTLVIVAAIAGLIGTGPVSDVSAGKPGDAIWVEYQRFARLCAPEELKVHVGKGQARDGRVTVWLNREFVEGLQVEEVTPHPESVEAFGDRLAYVFRTPNPADEVAVTFDVQPKSWGRQRGTVGVAGGTSVALARLVYP